MLFALSGHGLQHVLPEFIFDGKCLVRNVKASLRHTRMCFLTLHSEGRLGLWWGIWIVAVHTLDLSFGLVADLMVMGTNLVRNILEGCLKVMVNFIAAPLAISRRKFRSLF